MGKPVTRVPTLFVIGFVLLADSTVVGQQSTDLTTATTPLFTGSGMCALCHVKNHRALIDESGADLSPSTHWRSTMMANAARDPLWQAVVESESADHPHLRGAIETICTRCHAPMGQVEAVLSGAPGYDLAAAQASSIAMDGVSCTVCHQMQPDNLGTDESFSGGFVIEDVREIFGPYEDPLARYMQNSVDYTPVFSDHVNGSALCATCHTLFTAYVDEDGEIAGIFPEQVPYLEWQNSIYPAAGVECQTCHMPRVDEPVAISRLPGNLAPRSPFHRHYFVGGNTFMQTMLRDHGSELDVTATQEHFDATIARTRENLTGGVRLEVETRVESGELTVNVHVENVAGHKFPTGFPSRRAWIHVRVTNERGETVFESGAVDSDGRIVGIDPGFEPHRDLVDRGAHVQIYETVMKDVGGERTFDLLRAAGHLKDNRIPPRGFRSAVPRYEDMAIAGEAESDPDFNRDGGTEGTGRDTVTYLVDVSSQESRLSVAVRLLFQSIAPAFLDHVLDHESPAVARLAQYSSAAANSPEVLQSTTLEVDPGIVQVVRFRRGDVNADGEFNISDASFLLDFLFVGGETPTCLQSADANRTGELDISDVVSVLLALFEADGYLPVPFASCGTDPSSELGCESFPPCE